MSDWKTVTDLVINAYPSTYAKMPKSQRDAIQGVWAQTLDDLDFEMVRRAIVSLIRRKDFPPTISEVRREVTRGEHPSAGSGWSQLKRRIEEQQLGIYYSESIDPLVLKARTRAGVTGTTHQDQRAWEAEYVRLLDEEGHVGGVDEGALEVGGQEEGGQPVGGEVPIP